VLFDFFGNKVESLLEDYRFIFVSKLTL